MFNQLTNMDSLFELEPDPLPQPEPPAVEAETPPAFQEIPLHESECLAVDSYLIPIGD